MTPSPAGKAVAGGIAGEGGGAIGRVGDGNDVASPVHLVAGGGAGGTDDCRQVAPFVVAKFTGVPGRIH